MSFTILGQEVSRNVVLVNLEYPYGKNQVYMNGSLVAVAAQLIALGNKIKIFDCNIDNPSEEVLRDIEEADLVGVSVTGSPYIPSAIAFAREFSDKKLLIGGQVIAELSHEEFYSLFSGTEAEQIQKDADLAFPLGLISFRSNVPPPIPSALSVPMSAAWETMSDTRLKMYLQHEFSLVLSQGCAYRCSFCGALKGQAEQFVDLDIFRQDILYLAGRAKNLGLAKLECYASSLDFFQNPERIAKYLEVLAEVRKQTGVDFRVRCLSCTKSFVRAYRKIENLGNLLNRAGLWCIGFGVDGTDEEVWESQNKTHNDLNEVNFCLDICEAIGIRSEMLMVMGFAQDTICSLWKNLYNSIRYVRRWKNVMVRPYLAKPFIPGNDEWQSDPRADKVIENPDLFFNLDFCSLASRLTHPRRLHRYLCNFFYLLMIALLTPSGHCCTSPLLPQGSGPFLWIRKLINRLMPFDR